MSNMWDNYCVQYEASTNSLIYSEVHIGFCKRCDMEIVYPNEMCKKCTKATIRISESIYKKIPKPVRSLILRYYGCINKKGLEYVKTHYKLEYNLASENITNSN